MIHKLRPSAARHPCRPRRRRWRGGTSSSLVHRLNKVREGPWGPCGVEGRQTITSEKIITRNGLWQRFDVNRSEVAPSLDQLLGGRNGGGAACSAAFYVPKGRYSPGVVGGGARVTRLLSTREGHADGKVQPTRHARICPCGYRLLGRTTQPRRNIFLIITIEARCVG